MKPNTLIVENAANRGFFIGLPGYTTIFLEIMPTRLI